MKKTLHNELLYIRDLELNIKSLKEVLQREEKHLESLQEECNHDIVIVAKVISLGYSIRAKCLFCGEDFSLPHSLRELPNENILEPCFCKKFNEYSEEDIYNAIKQKAKYITKQTPDITKDKLRDELKKFLEEN